MMTKNIDFSDIASTYEHSSLVQRSAADSLLTLLDIKDNEDVLDLGCGAGNLTRKIKTVTRGTVIGIDPSSGMIKEAIVNNTGPDMEFIQMYAEEMEFHDSFNVIFCNSAFQWFKEPETVLKNCYSALRNGGRIGIQAPATTEYSPQFIQAIKNVEQDPRTKDIFSYFTPPWFFCETADEYQNLFRNAGFDVTFCKIITMRTRYIPQEVFNIFSSGAIAGYLNQNCYSVDIDDDYREAFKDIVKNTFIQQADDQGNVELTFHRIYLVAVKK